MEKGIKNVERGYRVVSPVYVPWVITSLKDAERTRKSISSVTRTIQRGEVVCIRDSLVVAFAFDWPRPRVFKNKASADKAVRSGL